MDTSITVETFQQMSLDEIIQYIDHCIIPNIATNESDSIKTLMRISRSRLLNWHDAINQVKLAQPKESFEEQLECINQELIKMMNQPTTQDDNISTNIQNVLADASTRLAEINKLNNLLQLRENARLEVVAISSKITGICDAYNK